MKTLEQEIEEIKRKHADLELNAYNFKLNAKLDELKKLEGTVEVRIYKSNKTSRYVALVHHVKYEMLTDSWKKESEFQHRYIGKYIRQIEILESPRKPYKKYELKMDEINPNSYNGKIHVEETGYSYDFSIYKTISVDQFNAIWNIGKVTSMNVLDGILDIKNVPWVMSGRDEDHEFANNEVGEYQRFSLDIAHIFLSQEESWKLNNKFTRIFLHKNIYLISSNSLKALDEWLKDEQHSDNLAYSACLSVGERWRGSRMEEYKALVTKIKSHVWKP